MIFSVYILFTDNPSPTDMLRLPSSPLPPQPLQQPLQLQPPLTLTSPPST